MNVEAGGQSFEIDGDFVDRETMEGMACVYQALSATTQPAVLVDAGAGQGAFSLLVGLVQRASCIAFEPNPVTFATLEDNIRHCGLQARVIAYQQALSNANGSTGLFIPPKAGKWGLACMAEIPGWDRVGVSAVTLDDVLNGLGVDVVKLDVEGMEIHVLEGAEETVNGYAPAFFVEVQAKRTKQFGYSPLLIEGWFNRHGYVKQWVTRRDMYFWKREEHCPTWVEAPCPLQFTR